MARLKYATVTPSAAQVGVVRPGRLKSSLLDPTTPGIGHASARGELSQGQPGRPSQDPNHLRARPNVVEVKRADAKRSRQPRHVGSDRLIHPALPRTHRARCNSDSRGQLRPGHPGADSDGSKHLAAEHDVRQRSAPLPHPPPGRPRRTRVVARRQGCSTSAGHSRIAQADPAEVHQRNSRGAAVPTVT
jgi:hypothetical protein